MDAIELAINVTLDLPLDGLRNLDPETLLGILHHLQAATEANQGLLLAKAEYTADEARKAQLWRQALAILDHLNATSNIFNMERHGKVGRLSALL